LVLLLVEEFLQQMPRPSVVLLEPSLLQAVSIAILCTATSTELKSCLSVAQEELPAEPAILATAILPRERPMELGRLVPVAALASEETVAPVEQVATTEVAAAAAGQVETIQETVVQEETARRATLGL
jgi:hypothetical protein